MAQVKNQNNQAVKPLPVPTTGAATHTAGHLPPALNSKVRPKDKDAEQIKRDLKRERQTREYLKTVASDLREDFKLLKTLMQEIAILLNDIQQTMEQAGLTDAVASWDSFVSRNKTIHEGLRETQDAYEKALADVEDALSKLNKANSNKKTRDHLRTRKAELERKIQAFKDRDLLVKTKGTSEKELAARVKALNEVATTQFGVAGKNLVDGVEAFNAVLADRPIVQENLLAELHKLKAMQDSLVSIRDEAAEISTHAKDPASQARKDAQECIDGMQPWIKGINECIRVGDALNQLHELRIEADQRVDLICKSTKTGVGLRNQIEGHAAQLRAAYQLSMTQLDAALDGQDSVVDVKPDELREIGEEIAGDVAKMRYKALRSCKELHDEGDKLFAKWNALQGKIEKLTQTRTNDWHRLDTLREDCSELTWIFGIHLDRLKDWRDGGEGWDLSGESDRIARGIEQLNAFKDAIKDAADVVGEIDKSPKALKRADWLALIQKMPVAKSQAAKLWRDDWIRSMESIQQGRA